MKLKNIGKIAVALAAGTALVATLINDKKQKGNNDEEIIEEKQN